MEDLSSYFLKSQRKIVNRVILAFAIAIMAGAFVLMLPPMTVNGITIIDAFFTSASAICVTGLIVQDTATFFTVYGKAVILILIPVSYTHLDVYKRQTSDPTLFRKTFQKNLKIRFPDCRNQNRCPGNHKMLNPAATEPRRAIPADLRLLLSCLLYTSTNTLS